MLHQDLVKLSLASKTVRGICNRIFYQRHQAYLEKLCLKNAIQINGIPDYITVFNQIMFDTMRRLRFRGFREDFIWCFRPEILAIAESFYLLDMPVMQNRESNYIDNLVPANLSESIHMDVMPESLRPFIAIKLQFQIEGENEKFEVVQVLHRRYTDDAIWVLAGATLAYLPYNFQYNYITESERQASNLFTQIARDWIGVICGEIHPNQIAPDTDVHKMMLNYYQSIFYNRPDFNEPIRVRKTSGCEVGQIYRIKISD